MNARTLPFVFAVAATVASQQPGSIFVPALATASDGSHTYFIAGVAEPRRQLTLIGSTLLPVAGRALIGLSFHRNAEAGAFAGGDATLTVRLSHSPRTPATALEHFARNHGNDVTTVYQGVVVLPNSPDPGPGPVSWSTENIVHVAFQQPFPYLGGTLALEVSGTPGASPAMWWPADAVWQPNGGSEISIGNGSGPFGGTNGQWSILCANNIGPAGTVEFEAFGNPGELAVLGIAVGTQPQRLDISALGVPGSFVHILDPFAIQLAVVGPLLLPTRPAIGGLARYAAPIPTDAAFLGAGFGSQWFRVDNQGRIASSNAHQWSTAPQYPALDLTLVTAPVLGAEPAVGKVVPACGHVLRFDYQ